MEIACSAHRKADVASSPAPTAAAKWSPEVLSRRARVAARDGAFPGTSHQPKRHSHTTETPQRVPESTNVMQLKTCPDVHPWAMRTHGARPYLGLPHDVGVAVAVGWGLELSLLEPPPGRSEDAVGASPGGAEDGAAATARAGQDRRQVPGHALLETTATQGDLIVKVEAARRRLLLRGAGHGG